MNIELLTIENAFKSAMEFEGKAKEIYSHFMGIFSHLPEIAAFWEELANEEKTHKAKLQNICHSLTEEQTSSPADINLMEKIIETQEFVGKILIDSICNLDDAYELAHEMEYSEVNSIFKLLATKYVSVEERANFLESVIEKHQSKLLQFDEKYGDKEWRKSIQVADL